MKRPTLIAPIVFSLIVGFGAIVSAESGGGRARRAYIGAKKAIAKRLRTPSARTARTGTRVTRAQLGATANHLRAVEAGREGRSNVLSRQPLLHKIGSALTGISKGRQTRKLDTKVAQLEARWGAKVTGLGKSSIRDFSRFRAEKAAALLQFSRRPAEVTEGFVEAGASQVGGARIAARKIFYQRWRPKNGAPASGKVVVLSPGFQETGRNFYHQIDLLNAQGHDVVVLDHQWAGYTTKVGELAVAKAGGIDRGFGVARDVAAVTAFAQALAERDYPGKGKVVLFGNSMGAGPGVLGAVALADAGQMKLELRGHSDGIALAGRQMKAGVPSVLQAPFLRATPTLTNKALALLGRVPGIKRLALPALGLPPLTRDKTAAGRFASHASRERIRARPETMNKALPDIAAVMGLVNAGAIKGRVYVIHGNKDPLASHAASASLVARLGDKAHLQTIQSKSHILEESPRELGHVAAAVGWAAR